MNCSTPGLPVHHQHPEFTQTHVHWVGDAIQPSHPLSSPSPPAFSLSQHQGLFWWVSFLWLRFELNILASVISLLQIVDNVACLTFDDNWIYNPLIKVLAARLLHCKGYLFPFVINKSPWRPIQIWILLFSLKITGIHFLYYLKITWYAKLLWTYSFLSLLNTVPICLNTYYVPSTMLSTLYTFFCFFNITTSVYPPNDIETIILFILQQKTSKKKSHSEH